MRHLRRDRGVSTRGGGGMSENETNGDHTDGESDRDIIATTGRQARRGPFGPGGGVAVPVERSDKFGATVRRLGTILGPERARLVLVMFLAVGGVALVVFGPRI